MTDRYEIKATAAFKISQLRLFAFLSKKYSKKLALENRNNLKSQIPAMLQLNPLIAPISERMLGLGLSDYRQLHIDEHNIVIYKVDELPKLVTLILIFDARQSIRKLLYDVNILL